MTGESLQELGATGTVLANLLTGLGIAALKPFLDLTLVLSNKF